MNRLFFILIILILCSLIAAALLFDNYGAVQSSTTLNAKKHNYVIFVELDENRLYLLDNNECVKKYTIAGGKPGTPSPIGYWKIISKDTWGEGFGGRWMGLSVPWGRYGIHGTDKPNSIGWDSSHGCIRMYSKDVKELYNLVPHGTRVVIVDGSFGSFGMGFRIIKPGARGSDVYAVMQKLKEFGYYKGYIDGIYGEGMKYAIHAFQKDKGMPIRDEIGRKELLEMGFREFE